MFDIIGYIFLLLIISIMFKNMMNFRYESRQGMNRLENLNQKLFRELNILKRFSLKSGDKTLAPDKAESDVPELAPGRESQTFAPKSSAPPSPIIRQTIMEILHEEYADPIPTTYEEITDQIKDIENELQ